MIDNSRRPQHRGMILLMQRHPACAITKIEENSTWLLLWLYEPGGMTKEYAILRHTGNVYRVHDGAVEEDEYITCDYNQEILPAESTKTD